MRRADLYFEIAEHLKRVDSPLQQPDPELMRRGLRLAIYFAALFFVFGVGLLLSGF